MRNWRVIPLIIIGLMSVSVACVSTKSVLVNPSMKQYPPVPAESVYVFTSESELDTLDYVRVAIIEATGSTDWSSQTGMIKAMRKKAGKLGANGIMLPTIKEPGEATKIVGSILGYDAERKGNVIAIRILGVKKPK